MSKGYLLSEDDVITLRAMAKAYRDQQGGAGGNGKTMNRPAPPPLLDASPETYLAVVGPLGLPAMTYSGTGSHNPDDYIVGQDNQAQVYQLVNAGGVVKLIKVYGYYLTVYNFTLATVPAGTMVLVCKDNYGNWFLSNSGNQLSSNFYNSENRVSYPNFSNGSFSSLTVDGTYGLNLSHSGTSDTLGIFPATTSANGVVTTTTQSFAGNKEFISGAIVDGVCFVNGTLEAGVTGSSGYVALTQFVASFVGPYDPVHVGASGTVTITGNSSPTAGASTYLLLNNTINLAGNSAAQSSGLNATSLIFDNKSGSTYPGSSISSMQAYFYSNNSSSQDSATMNSNSIYLTYNNAPVSGTYIQNTIKASTFNYPAITCTKQSVTSGVASLNQNTNVYAGSVVCQDTTVSSGWGNVNFCSLGFDASTKRPCITFMQTQLIVPDQTSSGFNNGTLQWNGNYISTVTGYKIGSTIGATGTDSIGNTFTGGILTTLGSGSVTSGTVTSVGLSMPGIFSVTGSPVTSSGTLTVALATQSVNKVFAGPASGSVATPTFRSLVAADLPVATTSSLGAVQPDGTSITISGGVISATGGGSYTLPTATTTILGGVKIDGTSIKISSGQIFTGGISGTYTVGSGTMTFTKGLLTATTLASS